jgi:hypothetical protein
MTRAAQRRLARTIFAYVASFGYWINGPQVQAPLAFEKYPTFIGTGVGPVSPFRDTLTVVPFSIPITTSIHVTGGGAALSLAVAAAGPGTNVLIRDSMAYDPFVISGKTNLTISVSRGHTPTVTAAPGAGNSCIKIQGGNSGIKISGLTLIGSGNGGGGSQNNEGLINGSASNSGMATIDRVIIESCLFSEGVATVTSGAPAVQLLGTDGAVHQNVWIHRCIATNCGSNPNTTFSGYGTIEVSGFSNVYIQNSKITRTAALARNLSLMRGFTWKSINVVVEDCLADDLGTGGANDPFKHHEEGIFGTAVGNSSVRNCVASNCKRGYSLTLAGVTMTCTACVTFNNTPGVAAGQTFVNQGAGTLVFVNGIIDGAGDGIAFSATVTENHNDIFNVAAPGKVLDGTDLTVDPVFTDPALHDYRATAPSVVTGASDGGTMGVRYPGGEVIIWAGV